MPRIRTVTAAGVLACAAVLAGAGVGGTIDRTKADHPHVPRQHHQAPVASSEELTTGEAERAYDTLSSAPRPDGG